MDSVLNVKRADFVSQVGMLSRLCRARRSSKATLSFDGQSLLIETTGGRVAIPAQGYWPGKASVPLQVLYSMTVSPPAQDVMTLSVAPCRFTIGTLTAACVWRANMSNEQDEKPSLAARYRDAAAKDPRVLAIYNAARMAGIPALKDDPPPVGPQDLPNLPPGKKQIGTLIPGEI